jgi:hypothetical protein
MMGLCVYEGTHQKSLNHPPLAGTFTMHRFGRRLLVKSSKGIRVLIRYVERVPYVFLFFFSDVILSQKGERHEEQSLFKGVTSPKNKYFYFYVLKIYICFWQLRIWKIFAIYGNSEF